MNISGLKLINKSPSNKEKNLVESFFRKSINLLHNKPGVILINTL